MIEVKFGLLFEKKGEFRLIKYTDDEIGVLYEIMGIGLDENTLQMYHPNEKMLRLKKIGIRYPSLD